MRIFVGTKAWSSHCAVAIAMACAVLHAPIAQAQSERGCFDVAPDANVEVMPYTSTPELDRVFDAQNARNHGEVERLTQQILQRTDASYRDPMLARWSKSSALVTRAMARYQSAPRAGAWLNDLIAAADLGHRDAAERVVTVLQVSPEAADRNTMIARYTRMAAELGSEAGACAMGGRSHLQLPHEEQFYWQLRSLTRSLGPSFRSFVDDFGRGAIEGVLRQYSPAALPAGAVSLIGGRSVELTLAVDQWVRAVYDYSLRAHAPPPGTPGPSADVREVVANMRRNWDTPLSRVILIIPGQGREPGATYLPRAQIAANLAPGDMVFARCGPLSHVATIYSIDRARGLVRFSDGFFQFWLPSHNSCIRSFRHEEARYGRFLSVISLEEVERTLIAVAAIRDAAPGAAPRVASSPYILPQSGQRALTARDIAGLSQANLRLARNEIFARRGRRFNDAGLRAYFERQDWYRPLADEVALNAIETANVAFLQAAEEDAHNGADYILPHSHERRLTVADLAGLSRTQLRLARNEIFARRGRIFESPELRDYFSSRSWYRATGANVTLSALELANVQMLLDAEAALAR